MAAWWKLNCTIILFVFPPKFCIRIIVFNFYWDLQYKIINCPNRTWKQQLCEILEGKGYCGILKKSWLKNLGIRCDEYHLKPNKLNCSQVWIWQVKLNTGSDLQCIGNRGLNFLNFPGEHASRSTWNNSPIRSPSLNYW